MDDSDLLNNYLQRTNKLMQNTQTAPASGRVAPPMPTFSVNTAPQLPVSNTFTPTATSYVNGSSAAPITSHNMLPRNYRRVPMPMPYMPSAGGAAYGGAFNNYPFRSYMNMGGYNPYSSFDQPMTSQYQNPIVIAAAENSRPAFESIQSVVQSFNAVSMMLESTFTAMHMSFQALLGVAENFTRLRMFMMKLYSTIVSFKLARWFLTKLFYLLRMVRGNRESNIEEDLWTALSDTVQRESIGSDGRSWPLVVFTGLLVATPYFVYKLLNSVTPVSTPISTNISNEAQPMTTVPGLNLVYRASRDWNYGHPNVIPLVKGQLYFTSDLRLSETTKNNGWVIFNNSNGRKGYAPISLMTPLNPHPSLLDTNTRQLVVPGSPKPRHVPSVVPEQIQPQLITTPNTDVCNDNPKVHPHSSVNSENKDQ